MVADADSETLPGFGNYGERAIVDLEELASVFEERCAPRRKLHVPGGPLDEAAAEPLLQSLQLQADRGLSRPHGFSRTRETAKLSDPDESLDDIQVEGALDHFHSLL